MSSTRIGNRLEAPERRAPRGTGAVHICIPPRGLSAAGYEGWQTEQMRSVPEGARPLFVRFVAPGAGR